MIPKIIHYCWFGGKPLTQEAQRCIASWKKHLPDYEIREWNERNFDIGFSRYTREAHAIGKYAFVSDVARLHALYRYGGIYFDTDVEVKRNFGPLLDNTSFLGLEFDAHIGTSTIGTLPKAPWIGELLEEYRSESFISWTGRPKIFPNPLRFERYMRNKGYRQENREQVMQTGTRLYPIEFLCAKNYETGEVCDTAETFAIHHYATTWGKFPQTLPGKLKMRLSYLKTKLRLCL